MFVRPVRDGERGPRALDFVLDLAGFWSYVRSGAGWISLCCKQFNVVRCCLGEEVTGKLYGEKMSLELPAEGGWKGVGGWLGHLFYKYSRAFLLTTAVSLAQGSGIPA